MSNNEEVSCIETGGDNSLDGWGKVIQQQGERHRAEQEKLQQQLETRTPDFVLSQGRDYEYGYWKADDGCGVVRYERAKGEKWMLNTKTSFSTEEIIALAKLMGVGKHV